MYNQSILILILSLIAIPTGLFATENRPTISYTNNNRADGKIIYPNYKNSEPVHLLAYVNLGETAKQLNSPIFNGNPNAGFGFQIMGINERVSHFQFGAFYDIAYQKLSELSVSSPDQYPHYLRLMIGYHFAVAVIPTIYFAFQMMFGSLFSLAEQDKISQKNNHFAFGFNVGPDIQITRTFSIPIFFKSEWLALERGMLGHYSIMSGFKFKIGIEL